MDNQNVMKKKIFSWSLCKEGMKQLKLIGILSFVIVVIAALVLVIGNYVDVVEGIERGYNDYTFTNNMTFSESNPFIFLTVISAFMMVMSLFGFMNKRNECDFYHSMPYTRLCTFNSFMGACVIWNYVIIIVSTLVTVVLSAILPHIELDMSGVLPMVFNCFVAVLLVVAISVFAMTLTGTVITNVIATAIFLFVPRGCIIIFMAMLSNAIPFIPYEMEGFFLSMDSNVIFGLLTGFMFDGYGFLSEWSSVIYSVLLAVVYMVAGGFLFIRRKSESATKASVNGALQYFFRLIPAFLISLIAIFIIFSIYIGDTDVYDSTIFSLVVIYVIAIIAYFLYEAITTRRLKNLVKAIPGLIGLVLINLVFIGGLIITYNKSINELPDVEDVDYVIIERDGRDYFENNVAGIKLDSQEVKTILVECLEDTVTRWQNHRRGEGGFYSSFYGDNTYTVSYRYNGKTIKRTVIVAGRQEKLAKALKAEDKYVEAFMAAANDVEMFNIYGAEIDMDSQAYKDIMTVFKEEMASKSFEDIYTLVTSEWRYYGYEFPRVEFGEIIGDKYCYSEIPLYGGFPKTMALYLNKANVEAKGEPVELYIDALECFKEEAAKNSGRDNYLYHDMSLYAHVYTLNNGTITQSESYSVNAYYDVETVSYQTGDKLDNIIKLSEMLESYEYTEEDLKGEIQIAAISFNEYEESEEYEETDGEMVVCYNSTSDSATKFYPVNKDMLQLMALINSQSDEMQ